MSLSLDTLQKTHALGSGVVYSTIIAVIATLLIQSRAWARERSIKHVPAPPDASWLWGHQRIIFDSGAGVAFTNWVKMLGSHVFRVKAIFGKPDILVIVDPIAVTHIMQQKIYDYHQLDRPKISRMIGSSLAWVAEEQEHKRMRLLFSPSLTAETVRDGAKNIVDAAENLRSFVEDKLNTQDPANNGIVVSIPEITLQVTLEVIGRFAFGYDFGRGRSEEASQIISAWRAMTSKVTAAENFEIIQLFRNLPFIDSIPVKALRSYGDVRLSIHNAVEKELTRRGKHLEGIIADDAPYGDDMLSQLLYTNKKNQLPLVELKDHVTTFVMAGSETTSTTISFCIWELARHPEVQTRLREEVQQFPAQPTYDQVMGKMPYLDVVTRETLRLHPAVPYMEREATTDDVLPLHNPVVGTDGTTRSELYVQKGQKIMIPMISLNRLDSVWGDGERFRPERWMKAGASPRDGAISGWSNTMSFSDGPRTCVGWRLALLEFKIIVAMLVYHFEFRDTGVTILNRVASSLNPLEIGNEALGPRLPIRISRL